MSAQPGERWTAADYRRDASELQAELNADARAEALDAADDWAGADFDRPDPADLRWDEDERRRLERMEERRHA